MRIESNFSFRMIVMQPDIQLEKSVAIAFDADRIEEPMVKYFDMAYWRSQKAVTGAAKGRGNSWFIDAPFGQVVLRQYLRGGWAARISRDQYFYTGVEQSRPFKEFSMLVALLNLGLPVPKPVAALCEHHGFLSRGSLMTETLPDTHTLADVLPGKQGGPAFEQAIWWNTGRCIRQFHDAGVWHADLNARNILLNPKRQVFLIDFDRARYQVGEMVNGEQNLRRLKRSLNKLCPANQSKFLAQAWGELKAGYDG